MKRFNIFATMALAMVLGLGAAIGIGSGTKEASSAEAGTSASVRRLYLIQNYGWSSLRLHYWGGSSASSWDTRPSLIDYGSNITVGSYSGRGYYYDIPSDTTGVKITGKENNVDKESKDFTLNFANNNTLYFASWDGSANKANMGSTNYKNGNPSSETNQIYVYDPHKVLGTTFANINVYGFNENSSTEAMCWPGVHSDNTLKANIATCTLGRTPMYSLTLSTSYPDAIVNCGNGNNQTHNILGLSNYAGKVLVIDEEHSDKSYSYHWDEVDIYTNCPATDGYYIQGDGPFVTATGGSGTPFKYESAIQMETLVGEDNKASFALIVDRTVQVRLSSYFNLVSNWLTFADSIFTDPNITKIDNNAELKAGSYAVYVNKDSIVYIISGIPLDAFCTKFLHDVGTTCDSGGSTNISKLKTVWSDMASLYDDLFDDGKEVIDGIGFNGGSNVDDPHRVVLMYHYIVTKYGSKEFEDFIWGEDIQASGRISLFKNVMDPKTTGTAAIVVISSLVAIGAFAGYFFYKKKKEDR